MSRLLAEDLLLLCWDDDRGAAHSACGAALPAGVGGALVLEALLSGALELSGGRVTATDAEPDDALLAEVVASVRDARRPPTMKRLVQRTGTSARLHATAARLAAGGVLRIVDRKVLWVFPIRRYPVADAGTAQAVRARVRALLAGERDPDPDDPRDTLLAALTKPTSALEVLFGDRSARREAERRAEAFGEGHGVPAAVGKVVQEAQAAAMAAVTAAVAASSSSSSSGSS